MLSGRHLFSYLYREPHGSPKCWVTFDAFCPAAHICLRARAPFAAKSAGSGRFQVFRQILKTTTDRCDDRSVTIMGIFRQVRAELNKGADETGSAPHDRHAGKIVKDICRNTRPVRDRQIQCVLRHPPACHRILQRCHRFGNTRGITAAQHQSCIG
jgi:hypothetical protein